MDLTRTAPRVVRAALFTALVVLLSAASHVLLSRAPLPLSTVAAIAAGVFAVSYAFAGRVRGFGRTAALFVPLELAADTVFTAGQHACYGPAGGPVTGPLRSLGFDALCGSPVGTPLAQVAGGPGRGAAEVLAHTNPAVPWLLLAAHVTVGLLATAWLRRGERALAELLRAAALSGFRPLLLALTGVRAYRLPPRRLRARTFRVPSARSRLWVHSVGRRGPPRPVLTTG
ncbi:hypothetical protein HUT18_05750 [Streptomyces sp. NA04227]|uniref:hypothetical protein n=1 Tax=Streptomyces sp. NA04227 TaxID=2742136 RepID=UPI001590DF61|nr:hypothetical protein [Streptomyces sp. NA04227]QKW05973.1 hypothetical protein HUT18_05750 [Streptomyces sp. NA04227]